MITYVSYSCAVSDPEPALLRAVLRQLSALSGAPAVATSARMALDLLDFPDDRGLVIGIVGRFAVLLAALADDRVDTADAAGETR